MALIKARTRGKQVVPHYVRLDRENQETLYAYAAFLGEDTDYIVNQAVDTILRKDRDFARWRAQHPESFVPAPGRVRRQRVRARAGAAVARTDTTRTGSSAA